MPRFVCFGLGCLFLSCQAFLGHAGDKLLFTGQKALVGPGQDKIAAEQQRLNRTLHFNDAPMPYARTPEQPKSRWRARVEKTEEDKRKDRQRAEKQNWALLAPGQLQEEEGDGYDFGVRDYNENPDEDIENKDYTFYGIEKSKTDSPDPNSRSRSSLAKQNRQADANDIRRAQQESSDQQASRRSKSHLNPFRVSGQNPTGVGVNAGSSKNLVPNNVFSGGNAINASGINGSGLANGSLLGSGLKLNTMGSAQDQRMESFRNLIGVNDRSDDKLVGSSSLINQSPDMTRQTLNPAIGAASSPSTLSSFGTPHNNELYNQRMNQQTAFGQPRVSGFSSLPSLDLRQPQPKPNLLMEPSPSFDVTRRKF